MAIDLTWPNVFKLAGLIAVILTGLVGGTAGMIQWRFNAVQQQLDDRMALYRHQMESHEQRLQFLEHQHP